MKRRDFMMALGATISLTMLRSSAESLVSRPRLLIGKTDPFTGLVLLKSRYQMGMRPSDDMEGWALSWQLTGDKGFAEKGLNAMRRNHPAKGARPSRSWMDYARWSLAFDWLSDYPGFEQTLRDRIATELMDGATTMLATEDFADPSVFSYHNYAARFLCLPSFVSAALEGYTGCRNRCEAWREGHKVFHQYSRDYRLCNTGRQLSRVDGLHAHHLGLTYAPGGIAAHHDWHRSGATLFVVPKYQQHIPL